MPYPAPFHRLVLLGDLYADRFATTLSIVPSGGGTLPAVTQSLCDSVATFVGSWWDNDKPPAANGGLALISAARLTSVKLNRIGTDGLYMDPDAIEHVYTTFIPGFASGINCAPQLSLAATIRGTAPRALAGRGRMYFPPSGDASNVGLDGRVAAAAALNYAKGFTNLLAGILDTYIAAGVSAVPGIASNTRSGAFQAWSEVSVGRVVDTVRSRRNKLDEDPQEWGRP